MPWISARKSFFKPVETVVSTGRPAIPISTVRRASGDGPEQGRPVFVEVTVYFIRLTTGKSIFLDALRKYLWKF
jgi:hypothetical protein